jgi:hypothetical protein
MYKHFWTFEQNNTVKHEKFVFNVKKIFMSSVQPGYNGGKQASIFAWNALIGTILYYYDNREHVISKRNFSNFPLCERLNITHNYSTRPVHSLV